MAVQRPSYKVVGERILRKGVEIVGGRIGSTSCETLGKKNIGELYCIKLFFTQKL